MNRALRMAAMVWMAVIGVRYLGTVRKSLRSPFIPGNDLAWLGLLLGFVALVAVSLALRRDLAMRIWTATLALCAAIFLLLSGSLLTALIALWVLAAATILGDILLVKLGLNSRENLCDRFVIAFPFGIVVFATVALALALLGFFTSSVVWVILLIVTLAELRHALDLVQDLVSRRTPADSILKSVPEARFLLLVMGFAVVRNLTWSVAPEVEFDTLNYHLAVPRIFLEQGRLIDLPYTWHSYFVHLLDYFFGFCMALHGEGVAKLAVAVIAIAAALSVYSLGRLLFSSAVGLWAAVFFYTTPLVSWGAATAYNDNAVAEFVTASLIAFLCWSRSRDRGWIMAAGFLAGGAIAIKVNAAYAIVALGAVLLTLVGSRQFPSGRRFHAVVLFGVVVCVTALPWYFVVYALTGNPIFPLMNGIFESPFWEFNNTLMNAASFGIGSAPAALLRLPFRITLDTTRFGESLPRGSLGPLLLVFIPSGFLKLRGSREARIVVFVVCVYLLLWAQTFQYARYYTAILPAIAVLGIGGFLLAAPGFLERFRRPFLAVLLIAQVSLLPLLYWRIPERFPVLLALGLESRDALLRRGLGGYGAAQYLNASVKPGEKVLAIGFEYLRFYLKPPLETLSESRVGSGLRDAIQMRPGAELARALAEQNVAYLLLTPQDRVNQTYPYGTTAFLEGFTTLEYSDETSQVFHLKR